MSLHCQQNPAELGDNVHSPCGGSRSLVDTRSIGWAASRNPFASGARMDFTSGSTERYEGVASTLNTPFTHVIMFKSKNIATIAKS